VVVGKRTVKRCTDKLAQPDYGLAVAWATSLLTISPVYCSAFTEIENSNDGFLKFEHM